jgi:uncharacterized protein
VTPEPITPEPISPDPPPMDGVTLTTNRWSELTYVHWAVAPERVAPFMPGGTRPDVFEGRTYVALVPFRMEALGVGRSPGLPYFGSFLETNVRLYSVDERGRRGVVFLRLETSRLLAAPAIRMVTGVPYKWARMRLRRRADVVTYESGPRRRAWPATRVSVRVGAARESTELEHFLTARWGAHVAHRLWPTTYTRNVHPRWVLRDAELLELDPGVVCDVGFPELADRPPDHVAYSDGVDARFTLPRW